MTEEDDHIDELKKETLKSSISIFLGLIISPLSIFITIWLTDVLSAPDIKIIDSNVVEVFNDVELTSSDLEYLKNDSYSIAKIQKFMNFGTRLHISLAKLKWTSAKKLIAQKDFILADMEKDLESLKNNLAILRTESFDWKETS